MHENLLFPVVVIKSKDPSIYVFSSKVFGLVSIGGEGFYKSGIIYDATGRSFKIKEVSKVKNASFKESLRFFQRMKRVELEMEFIKQLSLEDFKQVLIQHVQSNPRYWEKKDLIGNIVSTINEINDFTQLISYIE